MEFRVEYYESIAGKRTMKKTNFDLYLEEQMQDPSFASRFEQAGEAWDVALQIAQLREKAGLSQKDLAKMLKTSQQQISRLESPGYEGHTLSTLRRVAAALSANIKVVFEPAVRGNKMHVSECKAVYVASCTSKKATKKE
jgi:ribosome-binding protein aMBF1 (putative translation factor)